MCGGELVEHGFSFFFDLFKFEYGFFLRFVFFLFVCLLRE